jgi:branched-chain amino acid transport system permease protein
MGWDQIVSNTLTQAFGPGVVVFALAAIGLNVQFGYTGLLNFGQAAFAALGAYGLAMGIATLGWPFWWSIALGLVAALVLAVLLGVSTLRLRADYLAIATIAAAEAFRRVVRSETLREWTGGAEGIRQFAGTFRDYGTALGFERGESVRAGPFFYPMQPHLWVMVVGWTLVALCLLLVWLAMRSPWGRVLKAIREDEDAVRSLGKNAFSYKIQSLTLGGLIGALAGFVQALRVGNVAPDQYHTTFTFYVYAVLILGGAARVFGPVVGAVIFWGLFNFLTAFLGEAARLGEIPVGPVAIPVGGVVTPAEVGPFVFALLGVGIISLLIFRPQGIFGDRREISLNVR